MDTNIGAIKENIKLPSREDLGESFNRVYHGPDRLRREYELVMESERLGVPLDTYRRLYELRGEEAIDAYPKPENWWYTPGDWSKWIWHLPPKKKLALGKKGVVKLVQSGVILTIAIGIGRYVWEAPKREKLAHYQAWQMINSAAGQKTSGGRIQALQDLNKDGVSLQGLDVSGAYLAGINLQKANLWYANLSNANLSNANLSNANLKFANLSKAGLGEANLVGANLAGANLSNTYSRSANLSNANLFGANLSNANLSNANLSNANLSNANLSNANLSDTTINCYKEYCTNFKGAEGITLEQIKQASNWQSACYTPEFREELGLPPENPNNCAGEDKK
ncbi:MAG: pentapeptide repeat-containing protein [Calothrix sp. FI2-JRJ7]|jgi:uncharacterized protein YjbI with pentapeptide repeats|nr:pentapeptide repeat-containing protein [Calothrix sp. FI2-JRJ7]